MNHPLAWVLTAACLAGCGPADGRAAAEAPPVAEAPSPTDPDSICRVGEAGVPLPDAVRETSGLARGLRDPELFWTHNDAGNGADLFALDGGGRLVGRVRVAGAEAVDWEDLEAAPCGEDVCLYLADIGDNDGERERVTLYRLSEPAPGTAGTVTAEPLHARFPDGPRDAEALFADGSGGLYVVSKGRRDAITLYRYPPPQRPGETVMLERVRELMPEPADRDGLVTAATSTPDGRWVGIRSYRTLYLFRADRLLGGDAVEPVKVDLGPAAGSQGESLVLANDGTVWLTSEADGDDPPRWSRLRCTLPDA